MPSENQAAMAPLDMTQPDMTAPKAPAQLKQLAREGGGYLLTSAVALACDYGLLVGLTSLAGVDYLISAAVGFTVGLVVNYVLSVKFVFHERRVKNAKMEFMAFAAIGLLGLAVNEGLMTLFVEYFSLNYALAKIPTTMIGFVFNFGLRRALLFTASHRPATR